jgi:hypothetical protein
MVCAFHSDYEEPLYIIHREIINILVPGFAWRCSVLDSLLHSTLECLYSNTNCLTDILLRYMNYANIAVPVPPLNVSQLIRTSSNSKVVTLVDNLFVEEWKSTISYEHYFRTCAPDECQYTYVQRAHYLYIISMFLAVYGGLTLSLELLVPLGVKFVLRCRHRPVATNDQNIGESYLSLYMEQLLYILFRILDRISRMARLHAFRRHLLGVMGTKITNLNFFQTYSFGANVDQVTRIRLSRFTTRLYLCSYVICLAILISYTSIEQRTITKKIHNPSLLVAQQLQAKYTDTVECPCTIESIPIDELVSIQPSFHQVSEIDYKILINIKLLN